MTRLIPPLVLLVSMAGCIIYDEDVRYAEDDAVADDAPDTPEPQRPGTGDPGDDTPASDSPLVLLTPDAGVSGETLILSVVATDALDASLADLTDVRFFGSADVEVIATLPRGDDEFLITVKIPADATAGAQDLLLVFGDDAEIVADAFLVVSSPDDLPEPADPPPGAGGDGTGGAGDGTGGTGDEHPCP